VEGDSEKMKQIVAEVDRFFKSVHADIEDWKFSMEDYGDGTRIFVRFQIHINKMGGVPSPGRSKVREPVSGDATKRVVALSLRGGQAGPDRPMVAVEVHDPERAGAAQQEETDLASFVDLWRQKRERNLSGEYHLEGAPYIDTQSEWTGQVRSSSEESPPEKSKEVSKEAPGEPAVRRGTPGDAARSAEGEGESPEPAVRPAPPRRTKVHKVPR
jgi:hypothetical protein